MTALRTFALAGSCRMKRTAAAWLATEPALIQEAFASADCRMLWRGRSAVIQAAFHSSAVESRPSSNPAVRLHAESWPSLSQIRTCQKTCEREASGLPAQDTSTD